MKGPPPSKFPKAIEPEHLATTRARLIGLFTDDQTTVTALPLGKLLTVTIIAHNEAGESAESTPAAITLS